MANKPILIIQMQRLGDMVLTYPLLSWLSRLYPDNPLWVVGEKHFFAELMDFSPPAVYFEHDAAHALRRNTFRSVINISHRPEALELAGSLNTEELTGPYRDQKSGGLFIKGAWQLYRASLVNNNRYNLFHWADLNALDNVPHAMMRTTLWPRPREKAPAPSAHIGLFLGASEAAKHPDAAFWTALVGELLAVGHRPVLLGGEAEKELGDAVAAKLGAPALNLTGRFSLSELCRFIGELDLFVTPDTGPMHLAAWAGAPVLNISTGPVNAWETGPFSPGNHVLRAALPCVGCWHCTQSTVQCQEVLHPGRTAFVIHELATRRETGVGRVSLPDQELLQTDRDGYNLYHLRPLIGAEQPRHVTAMLWRAFFGHVLGIFPEGDLRNAWDAFAAASPGNAPAFAAALAKLGRDISEHLRSSRADTLTRQDFWSGYPLPLRPLTGYMHLVLQNGMFGKAAVAESLALVELLNSLR